MYRFLNLIYLAADLMRFMTKTFRTHWFQHFGDHLMCFGSEQTEYSVHFLAWTVNKPIWFERQWCAGGISYPLLQRSRSHCDCIRTLFGCIWEIWNEQQLFYEAHSLQNHTMNTDTNIAHFVSMNERYLVIYQFKQSKSAWSVGE